jgi:hypothetical protein
MIRSLFICLSLAGLLPGSLFSQVQLVPYGSIEVFNDGAALVNPWAGGLNSPQFSEIDLDNDGKKDLVAFERNFYGSVKTYINVGSNGESAYLHRPEYQLYFPPMRNWMLLRDYNCDGREDIFTSVPGGIAIYRNDPGPGNSIRFNMVVPVLQTFGLDGTTTLYVAPPDIPSITDIDNDGDLDILSFNVIGSTLEYHKNLSMENNGSCDELVFELRNACWGYFSEDGNNNNVTLFDTCEVNVTDPEKEGRHAGSTVLAIDLKGTGTKDLLLGDISYNNLVMLMNGGTENSAIMVDQEPDFPLGTNLVNITVFPAAYHLDVDNDSRKDLLVAPNNPNTSENFNNIWLYLNEGEGTQPEFIFEKNNFLQEGMLDLGERSFPVFFDDNGDGLQDIVIGTFGYFEYAGAYDTRMTLLRNIGTAEEPVFEFITDNYASLSIFDFDGAYPTFGDLDGDGDKDMLLGDEEGKLHLFTNEADQGAPADFTLTDPNYKGIDIGQSARPQIVDVNRDGLPDLLVGERSGTLRYFENTGTTEDPVFGSLPTVGELGGVDVMPECCSGYSSPFLTLDSLDNSVLYVGSEQGWLYLFDNIDGNLDGTFNLVDSLYLSGVNITPNGADINSDDKPELVYGEFAGGVGLLKSGTPPNLGTGEVNRLDDRVKVYPNPARSTVNFQFAMGSGQFMEIEMLDLYGNLVLEERMRSRGEDVLTINIGYLPSGIYFIRIRSESQVIVKKVIKD